MSVVGAGGPGSPPARPGAGGSPVGGPQAEGSPAGADAERVPIRARPVRFDWTGTPLHWIPGDPQTTHTINVLHLLLPAGERWFVRLYRQVLPQITDERLRADVRGFVGQEATHAKAHAAVLDHLAAQGVDATPFTRRIDWMFDRLLGDQPLGLRLPGFAARVWTRRRLAIVAAIEHFTAVLGWWVLGARGLDAARPDATMLDLLRWHGAEEVEHRAVAHDLYQRLDGSYPGRVMAMVPVAPLLVWFFVRGTTFLMAADPTSPGRPTVRSYWRAARAGSLPGPALLARAVQRYLRRDHHPLHEGSTAVALAYLGRSPAAGRVATPADRADAPAGQSAARAGQSGAPVEQPDVPAGHSDARAVESDAPAEQPDVPADRADASAEPGRSSD